MTEHIAATRTIKANAEAVFEILAEPRRHREIEGTGQVLDPVDPAPLTATGQVFRMNMYAEQGPTGGAYRMDNTVSAFDPPARIAWRPALADEDKNPDWPVADMTGWEWRYDLEPVEDGTEVTLTYDWGDVADDYKKDFSFPPFPPAVLTQSLANLAGLVER